MGKAARIKRERQQPREPRYGRHDVRLGDGEDELWLHAHGKRYAVNVVAWESGAEVRCPECGRELEE